MLTKYLEAAMRHARYEMLKDDGTYYGEISKCRGVYANARTLEQCRTGLAEALEDWLLFRIHRHLPLPRIDGIQLNVKKGKESVVTFRGNGVRPGVNLDCMSELVDIKERD